jgi:phage portal protein BeeE
MALEVDRWTQRHLDRFDASAKQRSVHPQLGGIDQFLNFIYNGLPYSTGPRTTMGGKREEPISAEWDSLIVRALYRNPVVFACVQKRSRVFSEARFKWRRLSDKSLWGDASLAALETPAPNTSTNELLTRMAQDESLGGNWYGVNTYGGVTRLHTPWVSILLKSHYQPDRPEFAADAFAVGYIYQPPGCDPVFFPANEVAHWAPTPDPALRCRGMSWITVAAREVMADNASTDTRLAFHENGMTPNMVITAPAWVEDIDQFREWREALEASSAGTQNAFRSLFLASGSDATAVGASLQQMQFKELQGVGETRIAAASEVPPVLLGISEGLAGSSLNQGNYAMARRQFADMFLRPQWRSACACLASIVPPPDGSELWIDESEIGFLHEDAKDAAEIGQVNAGTIRQYVDAGFTPESAVLAVNAGDVTLLEHTGLVSAQLLPPGSSSPDTPQIAPTGEETT